jgi:dTDP-4-dehydrorhamnose reductase
MKTAVIGSNGQLGTDVCAAFVADGHEVMPLTHADLDVTDAAAIKSVLQRLRPQTVINTAAMHNMENCEEAPATAFAVNADGARNLAAVCNDIDATLVHVSTDYVFDGAKQAPYLEDDLPAPLSVYGNTKLSGEHFIAATSKRYYVLRVSGLYGLAACRAKGLNFVRLMLKLGTERDEVRVVDNEFITPTLTEDIAAQALSMVKQEAANGLYHVTCEGGCSWYEFAKSIFEQAGVSVTLNVAAPGEFPITVSRPSYSILENGFLKEQGLNIMPHWQDSLKKYLKSVA